MTQRSILAGKTPQVVIRAGWDLVLSGWDSDQVLADTSEHKGMKIERRDDTIEVQFGGSGEVRVPFGSSVKIYTGHNAKLCDIQGRVAIHAGHEAHARNINLLVHASVGGNMDVECEAIEGIGAAEIAPNAGVKFEAGRDLRCYIRTLTDARLLIHDLGGRWEGVIGNGRIKLQLKAGGDVTIVTDQEVLAQPPDFILGKIERPEAPEATDETAAP